MPKYKSGTKKYLKHVIEHIESNTDTGISQSKCKFQCCSLLCELENSLELSMLHEPHLSMRVKGPCSVRLDTYSPHAPTSPFIHSAPSIPMLPVPLASLFWRPSKFPVDFFGLQHTLRVWTWSIHFISAAPALCPSSLPWMWTLFSASTNPATAPTCAQEGHGSASRRWWRFGQ